MPLQEARERFTVSEMVMISWRSQEQYWKMKADTGDRPRGQGKKVVGKKRVKATGKRVHYENEAADSLPDRFFNEEGELDLRQVTGDEALRYLNSQSKALGLPLFPVIMPGVGRGAAGPDIVR